MRHHFRLRLSKLNWVELRQEPCREAIPRRSCDNNKETVKQLSPNIQSNFYNTQQQEKQKKLDEKIKTKTSKSKKPQIELKDAMTEEEYKEKRKFYEYVRSLYKEDEELPAKIYAIVEDYRRKYNFTFDGMYKTLFYLHELKGRDLEKDIVGIIKYYYSEALKYYRQIEQVEELNKDIDVSSFYKTRTVCVTPRQNKKQKQIDISLIGEDSNA